MTELYEQMISAQLHRECISRSKALEKLSKDMAANIAKVNASNNPYGVALKRQYLGEMIAAFERQVNSVKNLRVGIKTPERYAVLNKCCGVVFKRNKDQEIKSKTIQDLFDIELACHIAFQLTLDAVELPNKPRLQKHRQTTKQWDGIRPTMLELQATIADSLWGQMRLKLVEQNFGNYVKRLHRKARGESSAKASPFYALEEMNSRLNGWSDHCQDEPKEVFESFPKWSHSEREIIGSWLLTLVSATGLFKKIPSKVKTRESTLEFSTLGKNKKDAVIEQVEEKISQPLPLIIPPVKMTKDRLGGWYADNATTKLKTNNSWKGRIDLSQIHLDFYNHAQEQPFRINKFVWEIVKELRERNEQLGKMKAYQPEALIPAWQEMDIPAWEWSQCENKSQQDALLNKDPIRFKQVKKARHDRYEQMAAKKIEGKPTIYLMDMVKDCINDERLYIPIEPDFRSRYTTRTSFLSYQGTDLAKGLLEFADGYEIDSESKRYLSIHLANQAGLDKEPYSKRINWVESNLDVIESIALMTGDDEAFDEGVALIKEFGKGEEFQFAAACREYYDLFIAHNRTKTYLPCAVDATCSGQQLIAGFLRSAELAERVNVIPTTKPGDIYRDCMDKMLELAADDEVAKFSRATVKAFKGSIGRKLSKTGFMSGQYGSGKDKQLEDMKAYLDDEKIVLKKSEQGLLRKYWPMALEEICKIRVVFNWFKDLVEELHALGKTEVLIPTPTGSTICQRYPVSTLKKITTFSFGSSDYKTSETSERVSTDKADLGKWKTATAANTIHGAGDASLLCLALYDFEHSFFCVHDSIASHAGAPMKQLQKRLKQAYVEVVSFDLWNETRRANGLPEDPSKLPALCNDLDLDQVIKSEYLFC